MLSKLTKIINNGGDFIVKKLLSFAIITLILAIALSVNVFAADLEIESVTIETVTLDEGEDGYWSAGNFIYNCHPCSYTVTLKDGRTFSGEYGSIEIDGEYYSLEYELPSTADWKGGDTYTIPATFAGFQTSYQVVIKEGAVESFTVQDFQIIEHTDGCYEHGRYYYSVKDPKINITFKDGSTEESYGGYWGEDDWHSLYINTTELQDKQEWTVGNTYEVTAYLQGKSSVFNVTIIETPIESIEIDDMTFIDGVDDIYYMYSPSCKVNFKEGWSEELDPGMTLFYGDQQLTLQAEYYDGDIVAGMTIPMVGYIGDVKANYNVNVISNPVESVKINDIVLTENTNGYTEDGVFYYDGFEITGTVKFKDGHSEDFDTYFEYNNKDYHISYSIWDAQHETPWTAGNTYTVDAEFMGLETTFNVTIEALPIRSIEIEDVTLYQEMDGYYLSPNHYIYQFYNSGEIILNDGTKVEVHGNGCWIGDNWYSIDITGPDQYETSFTPGNSYTYTAKLGEATTTFKVTVKKSPIKELSIPDTVYYEYTGGHYDEFDEYYNYEVGVGKFTVTYLDGTKEECYYHFDFDDNYFSPQVADTNQDEEPWQVGNTYTVKAKLFGVEAEFKVTIKELPIKSIVVQDQYIYYGIDRLYEVVPSYTVYFKDGSQKFVEKEDSVEIDEGYYAALVWDYPDEGIEPGKTYTIKGNIGKVETTFKIIVLENPVEAIELIKMPTKTKFACGEMVNINGAVIRIRYKDGKTEDVAIDYDLTEDTNYINRYNAKIGCSYVVQLAHAMSTEPGLQQGLIKALGQNCVFEYEILENNVKNISIKYADDKNSVITLTKNDNSTEDLKLLGIDVRGGGDYETMGYFFTDKGVYMGSIDERNGLTVELYIGDDIYTSNTIGASEWFDVYELSNVFLNLPNGLSYFDGEVHEGNVDQIIYLALMQQFYIDNNFEAKDYYTKAEIEGYVCQVFAIESFDVTLSKFYNAQTGLYELDQAADFIYNAYIDPRIVKYENGGWSISIRQYSYASACFYNTIVKLDSDRRIVSLETNNPDIDSKDGWVEENGGWYYYENGRRVTNTWKEDSTGWCYLGADGRMVTNGFVADSTGNCYIGENGYMVTTTGWILYNDGWYFLENGYAVVSEWRLDSTGWCYLGEDGRMVTNTWLRDSMGWCYIGENGYCVTNVWMEKDGKEVYIGSEARVVTDGWVVKDGGWYFLENGEYVKNEWRLDSTGWCYLGEDGRMVTNDFVADSTGNCYIGENGYMLTTTGWLLHNDNWYFLEEGYAVVSEWRLDSTGWCYLGEDGRMVTNDFVADSTGNCYIGENGYMVTTTGWILHNDNWYYLENGYAVTNTWRLDSKGWCYLGEDGAMLTNTWLPDSTGMCYIGSDGYCVTGWNTIEDEMYYFDENGVLLYTKGLTYSSITMFNNGVINENGVPVYDVMVASSWYSENVYDYLVQEYRFEIPANVMLESIRKNFVITDEQFEELKAQGQYSIWMNNDASYDKDKDVFVINELAAGGVESTNVHTFVKGIDEGGVFKLYVDYSEDNQHKYYYVIEYTYEGNKPIVFLKDDYLIGSHDNASIESSRIVSIKKVDKIPE